MILAGNEDLHKYSSGHFLYDAYIKQVAQRTANDRSPESQHVVKIFWIFCGGILPKFELIQAFMHVLVTCKNETYPIKNEGARVFTSFLPL